MGLKVCFKSFCLFIGIKITTIPEKYPRPSYELRSEASAMSHQKLIRKNLRRNEAKRWLSGPPLDSATATADKKVEKNVEASGLVCLFRIKVFIGTV